MLLEDDDTFIEDGLPFSIYFSPKDKLLFGIITNGCDNSYISVELDEYVPNNVNKMHASKVSISIVFDTSVKLKEYVRLAKTTKSAKVLYSES